MQTVLDKVHDTKARVTFEPEKTVLKATRHDVKPPKEKHIRKLVVLSSTGMMQDMLALMEKRLDSGSWAVELCALICYHRMIKEGPPKLLNYLRDGVDCSRGLHRNYTSLADAKQTHFAERYSRYLDEKIVVETSLGKGMDPDSEYLPSLPDDEKLAAIEKLDKLLLSLAKCNLADAGGYGESKGRWTDSMDPITLTALSLVVRDSFLHYKQLNKCLISMLENYFTFPLEKAKKLTKYFQNFIERTKQLNELYHACSSFIRNLDQLQLPQESLLPALQTYVKSLEETPNIPAQEPLPFAVTPEPHKVEARVQSSPVKQPQPQSQPLPTTPTKTVSSQPNQTSSNPAWDPFGSISAPAVSATSPSGNYVLSPQPITPTKPISQAQYYSPMSPATPTQNYTTAMPMSPMSPGSMYVTSQGAVQYAVAQAPTNPFLVYQPQQNVMMMQPHQFRVNPFLVSMATPQQQQQFGYPAPVPVQVVPTQSVQPQQQQRAPTQASGQRDLLL